MKNKIIFAINPHQGRVQVTQQQDTTESFRTSGMLGFCPHLTRHASSNFQSGKGQELSMRRSLWREEEYIRVGGGLCAAQVHSGSPGNTFYRLTGLFQSPCVLVPQPPRLTFFSSFLSFLVMFLFGWLEDLFSQRSCIPAHEPAITQTPVLVAVGGASTPSPKTAYQPHTR